MSRPLRTLVAPHYIESVSTERWRWSPVASFPIPAPRRHGAIARSAPKALPIRSGEDARAPIASSRHDRALGVACLVACPAISGLFLGLVALVYAYPSDGGHALVLGSLVGAITFAANALAICVTASTVHVHAVRRVRRAARQALEVASLTPLVARSHSHSVRGA